MRVELLSRQLKSLPERGSSRLQSPLDLQCDKTGYIEIEISHTWDIDTAVDLMLQGLVDADAYQ